MVRWFTKFCPYNTHHEMVAIRRVSDAALDAVTQDRTSTQIGHINPKLFVELVFNHMVVQLGVRHSRLDQTIRVLYVHFEDSIQIAAHVQTNASRYSRGCTTIPHIATNGEGPDRHLELIAKAHDGLHLSHLPGSHNRRRNEVVFVENMKHVVRLGWIQIRFVCKLIGSGDDGHVLSADDPDGSLNVNVELGRVDARGKHEWLRCRN